MFPSLCVSEFRLYHDHSVVIERNDVRCDNARDGKVRTHINEIILSQLTPIVISDEIIPCSLIYFQMTLNCSSFCRLYWNICQKNLLIQCEKTNPFRRDRTGFTCCVSLSRQMQNGTYIFLFLSLTVIHCVT
jgi:hypothetical protein